jgi:hypothetical protein
VLSCRVVATSGRDEAAFIEARGAGQIIYGVVFVVIRACFELPTRAISTSKAGVRAPRGSSGRSAA